MKHNTRRSSARTSFAQGLYSPSVSFSSTQNSTPECAPKNNSLKVDYLKPNSFLMPRQRRTSKMSMISESEFSTCRRRSFISDCSPNNREVIVQNSLSSSSQSGCFLREKKTGMFQVEETVIEAKTCKFVNSISFLELKCYMHTK